MVLLPTNQFLQLELVCIVFITHHHENEDGDGGDDVYVYDEDDVYVSCLSWPSLD